MCVQSASSALEADVGTESVVSSGSAVRKGHVGDAKAKKGARQGSGPRPPPGLCSWRRGAACVSSPRGGRASGVCGSPQARRVSLDLGLGLSKGEDAPASPAPPADWLALSALSQSPRATESETRKRWPRHLRVSKPSWCFSSR